MTNSAASSDVQGADAQSVMPDLPRRARLVKALRPWLKPKIVLGGVIVFLLVFIGVFLHRAESPIHAGVVIIYI